MKRNLIIIFLLIVAAIIVVASQVLFGKNSLKQQNRVAKDIAVYQHKIDSLTKEIEMRNIKIERLKNDSLYKEEFLRTKYGMSRKGEKVFEFVK